MKKGLFKFKIPCVLLSLLLVALSAAGVGQNALADSVQQAASCGIGGSVRITEGDERCDGCEVSLEDLEVYLYEAADLESAVALVRTGAGGEYMFGNMEPGAYVLGIAADTDYRLPTEKTIGNLFAAESPESSAAYTDAIQLDAGQVALNIDAVLLRKIEESEASNMTAVPAEKTRTPQPAGETGNISGFIWADDGGQATDWDGLYSEDEQPLAGLAVYLFSADDSASAIAKTETEADGTYEFEALNPGLYVVGLYAETTGSRKYLLPEKTTEESVFAPDTNSDPPMAFSGVIKIAEGANVRGIDAGMRLMRAARPLDFLVIQIGDGAEANGTYEGYALSGTSPGRVLTFFTAAGSHTYEIGQTGSSQFAKIVFNTDVKTEVTLGGITPNTGFLVEIMDGAEIKLLLSGTNVFNTGYITAYSGSTLTIDSAEASGSESGALKIITDSVLYAGIGGKGVSAPGTYCGKIVIDGGTIEVERRIGSTTVSAAAAIGGGEDEIGCVTINGGRVTASNLANNAGSTQFNGAAAIGGGFGTKAKGEVYINGGTVITNTRTDDPLRHGGGAAIGSGSRGSDALVVITGGSINAVAAHGAAIGGGYMCSASVTVTGGDITADSLNGAGLGNGSDSTGGQVKVTGGTIYAYNSGGSGIGAGRGFDTLPEYEIGSNARIATISKGNFLTNAAGIKGSGANLGDAFFVNLFNWKGFEIETRARRVVVVDENSTVLWDLPVPYAHGAFMSFSFTTGLTVPGTYKVYVDCGSGLVPLVRLGSYLHGKPDIIRSVNTMGGYTVYEYENPNEYILRDEQPFVVDPGSGSAFMRLVTEKCVDERGVGIAGVQDRMIPVASGSLYETPPREIFGFIAIGFKPENRPDGSGFDFELLPFSNAPVTITKDMDIYIVYKTDVANVTISKTVTGRFIDGFAKFTFTVYFADGSGNTLSPGAQFAYLGGAASAVGIAAPLDGILTLDDFGKASFTLRHGQTVTITNIPVGTLIKVAETPDDSYRTSFEDSAGDKGLANDTGFRVVGAGGEKERLFEFYNARKVDPVPTGVPEGAKAALPPAVSALAFLPGLSAVALTHILPTRRRRPKTR